MCGGIRNWSPWSLVGRREARIIGPIRTLLPIEEEDDDQGNLKQISYSRANHWILDPFLQADPTSTSRIKRSQKWLKIIQQKFIDLCSFLGIELLLPRCNGWLLDFEGNDGVWEFLSKSVCVGMKPEAWKCNLTFWIKPELWPQLRPEVPGLLFKQTLTNFNKLCQIRITQCSAPKIILWIKPEMSLEWSITNIAKANFRTSTVLYMNILSQYYQNTAMAQYLVKHMISHLNCIWYSLYRNI